MESWADESEAALCTPSSQNECSLAACGHGSASSSSSSTAASSLEGANGATSGPELLAHIRTEAVRAERACDHEAAARLNSLALFVLKTL